LAYVCSGVEECWGVGEEFEFGHHLVECFLAGFWVVVVGFVGFGDGFGYALEEFCWGFGDVFLFVA